MVRTSTRRRKQKKSRTHKCRRQHKHKQLGGVPPLNTLRFRYTKREERGEWVDTLYPLAPIILEYLKQIDWSTYRFEGDSVVKVTPFPESNNNNITFKPNQYESYETTALVTATSSPPFKRTPYRIFGGAACEVWNQAYPEAGDLHATTDPTADIDIFVENPYCIVQGEISESSELLYIDQAGNYTALGDSYTQWIYTIGIQLATKLVPHFSPKHFLPPNRSEHSETSDADMEQTIGPILVTRSQTKHTIKIQFTTKLRSGIVDHFLECLVDKSVFEQTKQTMSGTVLKNGLIVQPVRELFAGQLQGIHDRKHISSPIVYKLINHYGRLLYLAKLHEYTVRMKLQPEEASYYYKQFIDFINKGGFEPSPGCIPEIGCFLDEFIRPLCKLRNFNLAYGKCSTIIPFNTRKGIQYVENSNNNSDA